MEDVVKINIRLHNYPESLIALKNLKAAYIGNTQIFLFQCLIFHCYHSNLTYIYETE